MGRFLGITVKRVVLCRCLDGNVKEPYGMSTALESDRMSTSELEIKDTTESIASASYLNLLLSISRDGQDLHFPLRQAWRFQFPYYKLSVLEHLCPPIAFLSCNSTYTLG